MVCLFGNWLGNSEFEVLAFVLQVVLGVFRNLIVDVGGILWHNLIRQKKIAPLIFHL